MAYGFNQETASESSNELRFESAGIHSDVTLENIEYTTSKKDGQGDNVIAFNFRGKNGESFRHLEFDIKDGDEGKMASMAKRVRHILTKFIPEEKAVLSGDTFEEFAKGVIALLGNNNVGKSVAIKLVYNNKDYLSFTKYVGFIAKDAKDLSISKSEKITKGNATPTDMEAVAGGDELPF